MITPPSRWRREDIHDGEKVIELSADISGGIFGGAGVFGGSQDRVACVVRNADGTYCASIYWRERWQPGSGREIIGDGFTTAEDARKFMEVHLRLEGYIL